MDDIFGEVFRSVFGLPRRDHHRDYSFPSDEGQYGEDGYNGGRDRGADFFLFERSFPFFGGTFRDPTREDEDDQTTRRGDRHDSFGFGMFDMFEHMRHLFEDFGLHEVPAIKPPSGDHQNARDNMLKEPDNHPSDTPRQRPFFGWSHSLPDLDHHPSSKRQDSDLDQELERGNLDVIFGQPEKDKSDGHLQPSPNVKPSRSFRRISVQTYRNINGEIEQRKTIQDDDGNEETIITHQVGGKRHTVVKRKDRTGNEHVTESYDDNNDDDQIHEFGSKWNYHQLPPGDTPGQAPPADYQLDPDTRTIFERLFGRKFPGFSGRDC